MPQQGLRAGPGGRTRRRPPVHGAPWARGHPGAGPAGRSNQRVPGGGHRPLASFMLLDRQWATWVLRSASCRFRRRRGSRMGRHGGVGEEPGPVERHDGPGRPLGRGQERPGSVNSQLPEGHHPAKPDSFRPCRVRRRFFAFSKNLGQWPVGSCQWRPAASAVDAGRATGRRGWRFLCIYICIGRGEGSRAIDKDTRERDSGDLAEAVASGLSAKQPGALAAIGVPSQRSASSTYHCGYAFVSGPCEEHRCLAIPHHHFTDRPLAGRPCCRHSSPAELRRVAHMASQVLPRGGRERVSGVSHLPCEQF